MSDQKPRESLEDFLKFYEYKGRPLFTDEAQNLIKKCRQLRADLDAMNMAADSDALNLKKLKESEHKYINECNRLKSDLDLAIEALKTFSYEAWEAWAENDMLRFNDANHDVKETLAKLQERK